MARGNRLPYPGLRAFTRDESDLFFGRESCVDAMVNRLADTRFLAVLGPSGSGKSSLVRTGLLDALDLGFHPWAGSHWKVADLHPGGQPLRNLAAALLAAKGSPPEAMDIDLLTTFLRAGPRSIAEWASGGNLQAGSNLLILVDQFEELFRYGGYAQGEEAEAFVALLLESADAPGVPIHIVITMRSEYLGACTLIPGLAERINVGLSLTPRMGREECRAAIEGPAGVIGFKVEPALVTRLLNDLASFAPWEAGQSGSELERLSRRADQLPLMQHVLNRLWVRAASKAGGAAVELRLSDYERLGGLSGALDAHGEEVIASLGADRARRVEDVFRALVSGTSLALAVRRPCRFGELVETAGGARDDVAAIVEAFRAPDCNFLRTSEPSLDYNVIVDISHESLMRQWTPLREWLQKEARDGAAWRRLVGGQEHYAQREGGLLTGLDLHSLQAWWESASPRPAWALRHGGDFEAVQAFLETSLQTEAAQAEAQRQRDVRERKRLRVGIAALAALFVLATGLGAVAWSQAQTAKASEESARRSEEKAIKSEDLAKRREEEAKINADKARKNEDLAIQRERDAKINAERASRSERAARISEEKAKQSEAIALDNVRKYVGVLEEISNVLHSDTYGSLLGTASLQSELMSKLIPYQSEHSGVADPASIVRNEYRLGLAYGTTGEAKLALKHFAEAYDRGRAAINALPDKQRQPAALKANIMDAGYRYAWFLFDIGEIEKGDQVVAQLKAIAEPYDGDSLPESLLFPYGKLEFLKVRRFWEHESPEQEPEPEPESEADAEVGESIFAALKLISRAAELPDASTDAMRYQFYLHVALEDIPAACELAERMLAMSPMSPMDTRAIDARVQCLLAQARNDGDLDIKEKLFGSAKDIVENALALVPYDQGLLLSMTDIETDIADLWAQRGEEANRRDHNMAAKNHFVKALKGRTVFQSELLDRDQVKTLYSWFTGDAFPSAEGSDDEAVFSAEDYKDIVEAVVPTLEAFPKARSFSYVAADASGRIGELLMKDPARSGEAPKYFLDAIKFRENSGAIDDLDEFSEEFAGHCRNYYNLIMLHAAARDADGVLSDINEMNASCAPALDRYPWDFYLRQHLWKSEARAGALLVELGRHADAVPHLEYASHWGDADSSRLLADLYREGLVVSRDEQRAQQLEALAQKQGAMKRFTLTTEFGVPEESFNVFIREWPADYPFMGVDDQLTWWEEVRGNTVAGEVSEAFRELHQIARDNEMSFPELCGYALGAAQEDPAERLAALLPYEEIVNVVSQRPELAERLSSLGSVLLANGVSESGGE